MTHVSVDLDSIDWEPFLNAQEGGGLVDSSPYFQRTRYQRGFGIMGSVGRFLMPIVKDLASTAGQEAVTAGRNVLEDVAKGKSVKEALQQHGSEGLQRVGKKLQQCGKGKSQQQTKYKKRRYKDQLSLEDF